MRPEEGLGFFTRKLRHLVKIGLELIGHLLSLFQVGAAISMTYITSKPIVFVGTGQTYCDLRSLNAKAVVAALMKA